MTSRLRLVPATTELVEAELEASDRLAGELDADLPPDWPPEHHGERMLRFTREALGRPGAAGWWLHYIVLAEAERHTVVGTTGYKGPPEEGVVEIGYSVVPSYQRRGLATEACEVLIEAAWERGADAVIAHTLPHLAPSIRVLQKLGFEPAEPPEDGVLAFRLEHA